MTDDARHTHRAHALLSASGSHIWLACTGQPALAEGRERKSTIYTREGTAAHEAAEQAILTGALPEHVTVEADTFAFTDTKEHIANREAVMLYVDHVNAIKNDPMNRYFALEQRVSLNDMWTPNPPPYELFGTCDCVAVTETPEGWLLRVTDLKFGKGKAVSPVLNTQLMYYGLGAYLALAEDIASKIEHVLLEIVQPRLGSNPVKSWQLHMLDLLIWGDFTLKATVDEIAAGQTSLDAGAHCFFCPAASVCPELRAAKMKVAAASFPDVTPEQFEEGFNNE